MTESQRKVYASMPGISRVLLWIVKCQELVELANILSEQDMELLGKVCDKLKEATP